MIVRNELSANVEAMAAAVNAREQEFETIFDASPVAIGLLAPEAGHAFARANQALVALLGYPPEEMLGKTAAEIGLWRNPEIRKRFFEALHRDGFGEAEGWLRRRDGSEVLAAITARSVVIDGRQYTIIIARDITEIKWVEKKRLEREHKYRELVESANSIILRWSPHGEITFMNEFGLKFFGYSEEELVGRHVMDTIVPPGETTGKDLRPLMEEICHHPERFELNINENILRNGERVWITWTNKAVLDDCGQVIEVFSIGSDITEQRRNEAELQRYREHLEELVAERTAELRQAMDQLVQSEKLAALGSLVAGVAHELNTPLGNARMVASSLGEHLLEFAAAVESGRLHRSQVDAFLKRGREAVDLLERNTARAADLIDHFKQVAVDQTSMRRRRFDLRQTVEEVLVTLRPQFKRAAHRVELTLPPDLALDSYPGPLEQVIANLISNSLTHGFESIAAGVIRIAAAPIGTTHVQIDYTDNGVGIPEMIQKRIFDPFFTTRMGSGGSGLGLYIVYNLVTGVLGGSIQVHSPPGHGVAFTLTLPRTV